MNTLEPVSVRQRQAGLDMAEVNRVKRPAQNAYPGFAVTHRPATLIKTVGRVIAPACLKTPSGAYIAIALDNKLAGSEPFQTNRTARMQLVRADADFRTQTIFKTISKT